MEKTMLTMTNKQVDGSVVLTNTTSVSGRGETPGKAMEALMHDAKTTVEALGDVRVFQISEVNSVQAFAGSMPFHATALLTMIKLTPAPVVGEPAADTPVEEKLVDEQSAREPAPVEEVPGG